jgi:Holliday junction DNA helicase RuvB
MQVKKIDNTQRPTDSLMLRPSDFDSFIGQDPIKKMMKTAISSSQKRGEPLGHTLFSGPSGFGKTSLAHLISQELGKQIVVITGYALSKPAELISVLNTLQHGDILFIDEIHRLKPVLEEMLYIAMEDRSLDMVLPE